MSYEELTERVRGIIAKTQHLPAERMISTAKDAGLFQRQDVGWLFYDAEQLG